MLEWMMFQMGGVGPMFGQWNHFASYAVEKIPYAIDRYTNEVRRLHRVLDHRLAESHWLAGDEYSVADIITFPWIRGAERRNIDLAEYPSVKRGTTKWRRGPRCSGASPYWPTGRAGVDYRRRAGRITSAKRSSPHADGPLTRLAQGRFTSWDRRDRAPLAGSTNISTTNRN